MSATELTSSDKPLLTADFTYDLPDARIAKKPLVRGASKLLHYDGGKMEDRVFADLPHLLPKNTCLVFNDSKVLPARLYFLAPGGAEIEVLMLEPHGMDVSSALVSRGSAIWHCIIGGRRKWKEHVTLLLDNVNTSIGLEAAWHDREANLVRLTWQPDDLTLAEVLESVGQMPLPPYLNRAANKADNSDYQTRYAQNPGAVAAPTAGLHFTDEMLAELNRQGVEQVRLTLHVGAGTFAPVKTEALADHAMHAERYTLPLPALQQLAKAENLIAVGTTSLRTLETLYWRGASLLNNGQDLPEMPSLRWRDWLLSWQLPMRKEAFEALHRHLDTKGALCNGYSSIFILPGYIVRTIQGLITNFHQPQSTLLGLVSALVGEDWRKIYAHALASNYRFLSYGDSSLLLPDTEK